jgi:Prp8 binding protein
MQKRDPAAELALSEHVATDGRKRAKKSQTSALVVSSSSSGADEEVDPTARVSRLAAPTMELTGHSAAVYCICFDPSGEILASGSGDRDIFLWDVHGEECANYNVLRGHKNAVLGVEWMGGSQNNRDRLASCSADKTVAVWDANRGERIRKLSSHRGVVNGVACARDAAEILCSCSDDNQGLLWDARVKQPVASLPHVYAVTAVECSSDGMFVYTGSIDNRVRRWDMRMSETHDGDSTRQRSASSKGRRGLQQPQQPPDEVDMCLAGHRDTITGLRLSPDGNFLLSNAMDNQLRSWDIRPFVASVVGTGGAGGATGAPGAEDRLLRAFFGPRHGAEKNLLKCSWSPDQKMICAGSADRMVHILRAETGEQEYYLPGHKGSVNEVIFHPSEPVIASAGSDKTIFLGELI